MGQLRPKKYTLAVAYTALALWWSAHARLSLDVVVLSVWCSLSGLEKQHSSVTCRPVVVAMGVSNGPPQCALRFKPPKLRHPTDLKLHGVKILDMLGGSQLEHLPHAKELHCNHAGPLVDYSRMVMHANLSDPPDEPHSI